MIRNFIKIAWRNLRRNSTFSSINIAGLAIGLSCFMLIALYVADELSYDRFHEKADRTYRVHTDIVFGGNKLSLAVACDPLGATLKKDYPQVEQYTRLYNNGGKLFRKGDQYIDENDVTYADSTVFDVFTLPLVAGDRNTALNEPNSIVLSEKAAAKYFGSLNIIGKTIETNENGSTLYKVTGVMKDMPRRSHMTFDFMFSMKNSNYQEGNYLSMNHFTYIVLSKGTNYHAFERNFPQVINKHILPQAKQFMNINSMEEFEKAGNRLEFKLMPLTDIHLHSDRTPELGVNGNIQYIYIFSAVALFILLIACVNFMNLSTARSSNRAREVGIRKVLGTEKRSLIGQFLTESIIMAIIALMLGIVITWLALGSFNEISGKSLEITDILQPGYLVFLLFLPFVVGALAGSYPAFYLSSFRPISVLKGKINAGVKRSKLRNILVVFQFTTSIFLIVGTIIVYRQLNYIQHKQLGFNKDQLLTINGTGALPSPEAFKTEINKLSGVRGGTFSGFLPVSGSSRSDISFSTDAVMNSKNALNMQTWGVDHDYVPVMGMSMIKGRNFSKEFGTDSSAIIINETAAGLLGYTDPIGKKLYTFYQGQLGNRMEAYEIIGVVKNFHFESLKENISPLSFRLGNSNWSTTFKVSTSNIQPLINSIENKWKAMAPGMPFSYQFVDQAFDNMYRDEQRVGKVAITFAILSILIACLGLFGLAAYMAEQRTKEIGVRKVLGATVADITRLLSTNFLKLVLLSALIAFPFAWWAMNTWLADFAFRINIGWWVFVAAGSVAMLIALVTVSFQAIKAAMRNPVTSLRTE